MIKKAQIPHKQSRRTKREGIQQYCDFKFENEEEDNGDNEQTSNGSSNQASSQVPSTQQQVHTGNSSSEEGLTDKSQPSSSRNLFLLGCSA